ncbi:MAG: translocation/assembly module TamB, partial [Paramuribaculum sp.]|nr:translocation/assembly module TamB [Paramuribaculum sp.]
VQNSIRIKAEKELTSLLGMDVSIDAVNIAPFSRVTFRRVAITDSLGDTIVRADRLGAGLSISRLIIKRRLVVNYAEIIGLDARLTRDTPSSPLNIKPMIDALSPKDKNKPPAKFDFRVNTVVIRRSKFSYDVYSEAEDSARFDKNHIRIYDLRADLRLPRIANDNFRVVLQRLALSEQSGFTLKGLDGTFVVTDTAASVNGLDIALPNTHIAFENTRVSYPSLNSIKENLATRHINIAVKPESVVTLSDFSAFLPQIKKISTPLALSLNVGGTVDAMEVKSFEIADESESLWLRGNGYIHNLANSSTPEFSIPRFSIGCNSLELNEILSKLTDITPIASRLISNIGKIDVIGEAALTGQSAHCSATLLCDAGAVTVGAKALLASGKLSSCEFSADLDYIKGAQLFDSTVTALGRLGDINATLTGEGKVIHGNMSGSANLTIVSAEYAGRTLENVAVTAAYVGGAYKGVVTSHNQGLSFDIDAEFAQSGKRKTLSTDFSIAELSTGMLGATGVLADKILSGTGVIDLEWSMLDDIAGRVDVESLTMRNPDGSESKIGDMILLADNDGSSRSISLKSDVADVGISGDYRLSTLTSSMQQLGNQLLPQLIPQPKRVATVGDSITIAANIKTTAPLGSIVSLPVKVIYPVNLRGSFVSDAKEFNLTVDAPYLQQGNRLLENTTLAVKISDDIASGKPRGNAYFSTVYPTKKGEMTIDGTVFATDNHVDTQLDWKVDRDRDFNGNLSLSATFARDSASNKRMTLIDVNPGKLVFNDTAWTVSPAKISIKPEEITVADFRIGRGNQYLSIQGVASENEDDKIDIALRGVSLDYVFETLDIPTAMFGGVATGDIAAAGLLSRQPLLLTDNLDVKRLSYNYSLMGDTKIKSHWDNASKAIVIDAAVSQPNGGVSKINGEIKPLADSLDLYFDADRIEVGFLKPFMAAFTSSVSGYASGKAHLWGSFKYIDMVGDIFAEDLKLKLDFTNTIYSATDSVRLTPGHIDLKNITLTDVYGNTAILNGTLDHKFFKEPRFNFEITDAKNMLVYDVRENNETNWYGRVFANGSASVTGEPGIVNIGVDMTTAPNSTFTFVLNDAETASDYTFITFRDRDRDRKDSIAAATAPPKIVRELKQRIARTEDVGSGSVYTMNIAIGVNPAAQINLVMDPVGGDRIRAYGSGNLRMTYDSSSEDLKMFGTYTLQRGNYNFTLQDIIIKDFTIREGSSISFHGDPYAAQLNIQAVYSLTANLSDLDESFLEDRELNRTNVPVHALMLVSGDMRQPDIAFDLEFPTLSQDTYHKVKSIVSTEDMMNRQIIYLLALNKFYTPDYMNTTKGNEFVSVASSTISSQLSSMLGQLSENWRLAPNIRSDRGDFSDVEVDLALSSQLLNNRLLLNGNFGYRDKTLNNNSFIGDFDIEYLINRSGNLRLKAYNRYNDRNYYVKNALTTQGVGIVLKRDFDNIFSFLRRKKKKNDEVPADTLLAPVQEKSAPSEENADWIIIR